MKIFFHFFFIVSISRACNIAFEKLDALNVLRQSFERDIFNISGQLEYCPSSLTVQNISISNPQLKRLSILNVSFLIETNKINVTTLARLIGFAPLTVQFYFKDGRRPR